MKCKARRGAVLSHPASSAGASETAAKFSRELMQILNSRAAKNQNVERIVAAIGPRIAGIVMQAIS
jgi:hypothetical protein